MSQDRQEFTAMADLHNAIAGLVKARQGDETLVSLLSAAASRVTGEAQERATTLRQEARRLRHQAWRDLLAAKSEFEAALRRTTVIRGLELDDELKMVALRAASRELVRAQHSLRRAACAVEAAVTATQLAEAQAEDVVRRAAACPEVAACETLSLPLGRSTKGERAIDRKPGGGGHSGPLRPQATAPHPARTCIQAPDPVCPDGAHAT